MDIQDDAALASRKEEHAEFVGTMDPVMDAVQAVKVVAAAAIVVAIYFGWWNRRDGI